MQERHLDALMEGLSGNQDLREVIVNKGQSHGHTEMRVTAAIVAEETTNLPDGMRTPTNEELNEMRRFIVKYRST